MERPEQKTGNSFWDSLIRVIDSQAETYEKFHAYMKRKQHAIIKGDTHTLKTLEGEEKQFLNRLEELEDLRRDTAVECLDREGVTLRDLLQEAPESHRPALEQASVRLMEAINSVVITHKSNTELLEEAIHFVQFNLNLLTTSSSPADSIYGSSGRISEAESKIKGLLNKQV